MEPILRTAAHLLGGDLSDPVDLGGSNVADRPLHRTRRPVPSARQLLVHRWGVAGTLADLPAFAEAMELLRKDRSGEWAVDPLPPYPAFRDAEGRPRT